MHRLSFYHRFFLGTIAIIVIIVLLAAGLTSAFIKSRHLAEIEANQDLLTRVAQSSFQRLWPLPPDAIDAFCKELSAGGQMRVTFIAPDGTVLGDGTADPRKMENHRTPDRLEVLEALQGRPGQTVRRSGTMGVEYRYLARPVMHEGAVVGAIRVAVPTSVIASSQASLRNIVLWCAGAALLASSMLAGLVSWLWYAPLQRVTATADQLACGDLTARAEVRGPHELARLAAACNRMRDSLAGQIQTIQEQREDVKAVVASLEDAVVASDAEGQVILANQAAGRLLGLDAAAAIGQTVQAAVPVRSVLDVYEQAMAGDAPVTRQLELLVAGQRRTVTIQAARVRERTERIRGVLVARDITELARTAAVKSDFFANASHELRTPLATVRAATDSLRMLGNTNLAAFTKFVAMLDRNVKRLEDLTNDLLDLHVIERGGERLRPEKIAASALAQWARTSVQARAEEKGLSFSVNVEGGDFTLCCDRKLLETILQNLLDNALKFTPKGGQVRLALARQDGHTVLSVADTGCGIALEHQPRVFERFFQVDPARSGDGRSRGTGLGLAIVKHAAERLGATVSLQSEPGRGTTVTVVLPDRPPA